MPTNLKEWLSPSEVRALLDAWLDDFTLPDSIIEMNVYGGAAIRQLVALDPTAAERTDKTEIETLQAALNMLVAAKIAPSVPALTAERLPTDDSYSRTPQDWQQRAKELFAEAVAAISSVTDSNLSEVEALMPSVFSRASAERGVF